MRSQSLGGSRSLGLKSVSDLLAGYRVFRLDTSPESDHWDYEERIERAPCVDRLSALGTEMVVYFWDRETPEADHSACSSRKIPGSLRQPS